MATASPASSPRRPTDSGADSRRPGSGPNDRSDVIRVSHGRSDEGSSNDNGHRLKRALLIIDVSNLYYCVRKQHGDQKRLDYERLIAYLIQEVSIEKAIAYGAEMGHVATGFRAMLKRLGFQTKYKQPKIYSNSEPGKETRKADWDVGMAMDVVRLAKDYDIIIFGTADGDLAPCLEYVKESYPNKECWVLACGISRELKIVADQWQEIPRELIP